MMICIVSCSKQEPQPIEATGVSLSKTTLTMEIGNMETLTATVSPNNAANKTVTWSSSKPEVAAVDANTGKITAIANGTATITASTVNGKKGSCEVTVNKAVIAVTDVVLNKTTLELKIGDTETLIATVSPDDATDKTVAWSSNKPEVATVDAATGKVTAIAEGSAIITATAGNKSATCEITVIPAIIANGTMGTLSWELTGDGKFTVSGNGEMPNYDYDNAPWNSYRDRIKMAIIESGVTTIGDYAFIYCNNMTAITIPAGITSIGDYAFSSCNSLATITIPAGVANIGDYALSYCTSLATIAIPAGMKTIGEWAFRGCDDLTSITLSDDVVTIGASAFYNCYNLTSITIPKGVTTIGDLAFELCGNLASIEVADDNPNYSSVDGLLFNKAKDVILVCPVAKEGSYTIPNSVKTIGNSAFAGSRLTSISIPSSVTTIGNWAFQGCGRLTSIAIPEGVTSIGFFAFSGCRDLTSIIIPSSLEIIEFQAFSYCSSLSSITIPEGVKSIGDYAFNSCTNLTSITISSSVTAIGDYVFQRCTELVNVTISATIPPTLGVDNFTIYNDTLYVPVGHVVAYKGTNWNNAFTTIVEIGS